MKSSGDKANGADAGWKLLGSQTRFEGEVFRVREDEVELKDGKKIKFAYLERGEAVVVVPVTKDGQMVLLKQYRYAVDEWCLEVPAGGTHDSGDASLEDVARKELKEEVGATAARLTYVDYFFSASGITDEKCHVYLAEGVELSKKQETEAGETIEVQLVPIAKGIELARTGAIRTGPCALAILLCETLLEKFGQHAPTPPDWLET
jgi:ADP-ribose pyrophosphatase